LSLALNQVPGVVENGLFIDICDAVVIGYADGRVETARSQQRHGRSRRILFEESDNIFRDL
jgi:ribose 5-phosphate isomerase A